MSEINQRMPVPGMGESRPGVTTPGSMFPGGPMPPAPGQGMPPAPGSGMRPDGTMRPGQGMPPAPGSGMRPDGMMRPGQGMSPGNMQGPGGNMQSPGNNMQNSGMNGMMPGNMGSMSSATNLCAILRQRPHATAVVRGGSEYSDITGRIMFYQMRMGVLVAAEVFGLPSGLPGGRQAAGSGNCNNPIFGFHIHSGSSCSGNMEDPFADAMEHYNPEQCMHPQHAGDMPPLFGNNGYAFQVFLTDRFTVREILGKTVIIHSMPDDFRSQPGGDSGTKIACGQILGREVR